MGASNKAVSLPRSVAVSSLVILFLLAGVLMLAGYAVKPIKRWDRATWQKQVSSLLSKFSPISLLFHMMRVVPKVGKSH